jgi:hypothetical protein
MSYFVAYYKGNFVRIAVSEVENRCVHEYEWRVWERARIGYSGRNERPFEVSDKVFAIVDSTDYFRNEIDIGR